MVTTVKKTIRTHFENGQVQFKKDAFYVYRLINMESVVGHDFILVNAMHTLAFSLSDDIFNFGEVESEMLEYIESDYIKENFSFDFDSHGLETLMYQKFGEDVYSFNVWISSDFKKIENIHIMGGIRHGFREFNFSKQDLPFREKEAELLFNSLATAFSPILPLMKYLQKNT